MQIKANFSRPNHTYNKSHVPKIELICTYSITLRAHNYWNSGIDQTTQKQIKCRQKLPAQKIEWFVQTKISFDLGKNGCHRQ